MRLLTKLQVTGGRSGKKNGGVCCSWNIDHIHSMGFGSKGQDHYGQSKAMKTQIFSTVILNKKTINEHLGCKWRNWIQSCLTSSKGSILVNGCPTNEFQFYKGLKQGEMSLFTGIHKSHSLFPAITSTLSWGCSIGPGSFLPPVLLLVMVVVSVVVVVVVVVIVVVMVIVVGVSLKPTSVPFYLLLFSSTPIQDKSRPAHGNDCCYASM
ncbi:hypothetical protein Tco_1265983 [Tanacetum coccineum]